MQPHYVHSSAQSFGLKPHYFMPHTNYSPLDWLKSQDEELPQKIIILGNKNLEVIKGYKAHVSITTLSNEVVIRITGQSAKFANLMIKNLEELPKEEIYSNNKLPKKKRVRKNKK